MVKHPDFNNQILSDISRASNESFSEIYEIYTKRAIFREYGKCYIDLCIFYSIQEFEFFLENAIPYYNNRSYIYKRSTDPYDIFEPFKPIK